MCHGIRDFKYVVNSDVVNADDLLFGKRPDKGEYF